MSDLKLRFEEHIISSDKAFNLKGLLAFWGELIMTNQRLFFFPDSSIDRLAGAKDISISLTEIEMIDIQGIDKIIHFHVGKDVFRFTGKGAHRILERVKIRRKAMSVGQIQTQEAMQEFREIVYLQGDAEVYVRGRMSVNGQMFLTSREIRIESSAGLESVFFSDSKMRARFEDITDTSFNLIEKKLKICSGDKKVEIGGPLAPKAYLLLRAMKEGELNGDLFCVECVLFRGMLAIKGLLQGSRKNLLFCPTESVDSLAGADFISIKLDEILDIKAGNWPEKRLKLQTKASAFTFEFNNVKDRFKQITSGALEAVPNNWHSENKIKQEALKEKLESRGLAIQKHEKFLWVEWCAEKKTDLHCSLGWMCLSNLKVYFIPESNSSPWSDEVSKIKKTPNRLSGIGITGSDMKQLFFHTSNGIKTIRQFWKKIEELKPPPELRAARSGQPLDNLLGRAASVDILKGDRIVHSFNRSTVRQRAKGIHIGCSKQEKSSVSIGDKVIVEIPKDEGRYRFRSKVVEMNLLRRDSSGMYSLMVEDPENVFMYTKRHTFRIEFEEKTSLKFISNDSETEVASEINSQEELNAQIIDISFGGCGLLLDSSPEDLEMDPKTVLAEFKIPLKNKQLRAFGEIRHISRDKKNPLMHKYGIQFVKLPKETANEIFLEVLRLERKMLRELEDKK